MAFRLSSHFPHLNSNSHSKSIRSRSRTHGNPKRAGNENSLLGLFLRCCDSSSLRQTSPASASASSFPLPWSHDASSSAFDPQTKYGISEPRVGFDKTNRIDRLVRSLHEASRSFSVAAESLKLTGKRPELAMAWVGKDVHDWHKRISHMVAVYALLKMAIEVEVMLSHERHFNYASPVKEILTPKITLLGDYIESQLNERHSELGEWFRVVEMPRVAAFFISLLKKWSMEYAGSGIAGMVVAISCCAAVEKLGPKRVTCSSCKFSIKDVMVEFMDRAHSLVTIEKLHQLSNEAGFESDFLTHFGRKIVLSKKSEELEFCIGLAQKKLVVAFHKEIINSEGRAFSDKVQANTLATLGLFAYIGRMTRLYLSVMGIKDLDDPVRDLLSYLECGSIFIYSEFSNISSYQSFMEIVTDEIGWLDFYAPFPSSACNQERRRSKQHAVQAEKEIVLSTIVTVCYDVFSGFAHFNRSTQQHLDNGLLKFLLQSQSLLASCLEDYWAVYGKTSQYLKISTMSVHDPTHTITAFTANDLQRNPSETNGEIPQTTKSANPTDKVSTGKTNPIRKRLLQKYTAKLMSASTDVWIGSQLLYGDIAMAVELLYKQLRGHESTRRERFRLRRTLNDIGSLIPVTILMLLPVSAVGHAAMLAAIKKYIPSMIPSPYSSARLSVVKQLERTKKMEVRMQSSFEDLPATIS